MSLFRKGGTIDYTALEKRGIIKKPQEKKSNYKINSQGVLDFTSAVSSNIASSVPSSSSETPSVSSGNAESNLSSPFSFFDSIARNASSETPGSISMPESPAGLGMGSEIENKEISALKIKIEDLEYKLESFIQKIEMLESKLSVQ